MFSNIGTGEIIVVVLVALLIFGPRKLPEIARNFGKAFHHFKKSYQDVENEIKSTIEEDKPHDKTM
ncbi:MAG: twin-arginine translocase TatA/TatE family subunit [Ignavibacteriales bacterium]|mgnify:CR=1 FL=1|jgi:TatA/E family protein of Tat protein translocase|nr:twin-arginine translocase TatA/TatE family subunit [Ignavibacteriaceae bacterium]NLH60356.1 twin-arginine translocase TatA/TatE family subunit [Ignavibacteriales bacterium]HOJ18143.1 twin-arginine translocase TatA/TatE family subunit [Ignavibacteriaceae bacterium]HPO56976.1 twin-arginine translocase TatA/TatE family subunit [Ignavibacteriaceae bacterium]